MSAPDTNVKKQGRRHRPAIIAIALAVLFGLVMAFMMTANTVDNADENIADPVVEQGELPAGATETPPETETDAVDAPVSGETDSATDGAEEPADTQ